MIRQARRGPRDPQIDKDLIADILSDDDKTAREGRIRCPLCGWKPRAEDRWMCTCGHAWNTFDTRGRCPHCGRQWLETQCLSCGGWSRHEDWYAAEPAS
jgi:hypothetical protein